MSTHFPSHSFSTQIFEEMEKINWNKKVSQPSKMQQVQSYVISGDVDGLLDVMHGWLTEDMDREEEDDEDDDGGSRFGVGKPVIDSQSFSSLSVR